MAIENVGATTPVKTLPPSTPAPASIPAPTAPTSPTTTQPKEDTDIDKFEPCSRNKPAAGGETELSKTPRTPKRAPQSAIEKFEMLAGQAMQATSLALENLRASAIQMITTLREKLEGFVARLNG